MKLWARVCCLVFFDSRCSWLVTYRNGIPARRRSPIPVLTGPTCVNFVHATNSANHCATPPTRCATLSANVAEHRVSNQRTAAHALYAHVTLPHANGSAAAEHARSQPVRREGMGGPVAPSVSIIQDVAAGRDRRMMTSEVDTSSIPGVDIDQCRSVGRHRF